MEDIKKRPLSEEELEQVSGGVDQYIDTSGKLHNICRYCGNDYPTKEEAQEHEENCPCKDTKRRGNSLKPIIL